MMKKAAFAVAGLAGLALLGAAQPAAAWDTPGWGPAYQPESSYFEPGMPLTPGEIAGRAYRARTGRGVYDDVEGPRVTGSLGYGPVYAPRRYYAPRAYHARPRVVRPPHAYRGRHRAAER